MLLMVENDLRGGTRHAVHRYVQICNKCERLIQLQPSQTSYTGMSTICRSFQGKKKSRFTLKFLQNYDDDSDKKYILEVDVSYPNRLQRIHSGAPFCLERMKIGKCQKLVYNLYSKNNYVICLKVLKLALKIWTYTKKIAWDNRIQSRSMVETLHRQEYRIEKNGQR